MVGTLNILIFIFFIYWHYITSLELFQMKTIGSREKHGILFDKFLWLVTFPQNFMLFFYDFQKFIKNASPDERMIVSDILSEPSKILLDGSREWNPLISMTLSNNSMIIPWFNCKVGPFIIRHNSMISRIPWWLWCMWCFSRFGISQYLAFVWSFERTGMHAKAFFYLPVVSIRLYGLAWSSNGFIKRGVNK